MLFWLHKNIIEFVLIIKLTFAEPFMLDKQLHKIQRQEKQSYAAFLNRFIPFFLNSLAWSIVIDHYLLAFVLIPKLFPVH